jgi:hypothetical protein
MPGIREFRHGCRPDMRISADLHYEIGETIKDSGPKDTGGRYPFSAPSVRPAMK